VADLVERIRDEMKERIVELRPAVQELQRLEAAVAALGESSAADGDTAAAETPGPAAPRRRGRPKGSGRPRRARSTQAKSGAGAGRRTRRPGRQKGSGQRAAQAVEVVTAQPGIAIPEIAAAMGIKQNYLYRVMPALEAEGKVEKRGRGWHLKG